MDLHDPPGTRRSEAPPISDLEPMAGIPPEASAPSRRDRRSQINRAIAALEMVAGICGLGLIASMGTRVPAWFVLLFASVFGTCLVAGSWLWKGESRGLRLSFAIQALQSVAFSLWGLTFVFVAGPMVFAGVSFEPSDVSLRFSFFLTDSLYLWLGELPEGLKIPCIPRDGHPIIGINLVPLLLANYLSGQAFPAPNDPRPD